MTKSDSIVFTTPKSATGNPDPQANPLLSDAATLAAWADRYSQLASDGAKDSEEILSEIAECARNAADLLLDLWKSTSNWNCIGFDEINVSDLPRLAEMSQPITDADGRVIARVGMRFEGMNESKGQGDEGVILGVTSEGVLVKSDKDGEVFGADWRCTQIAACAPLTE